MNSKLLRPAAVLAGIALVAASTVPALASTGDDSVVATDLGSVRGVVSQNHRLFQGIPYAAPPTGPLRWGSPRPAARWTGVRDATQPGKSCAQGGDFIGDKPSESEDCLYLNVTTPRRTDKKLPVMVWMHGGGFMWGSGDIYGAERLATRGDVIVVTLNYRLGVLGFLAHPALNGGPAKHLSGNLGIEDQQAALRWVRRNAAAFGGDAANVTVFGESAGAMVSCAHLTAPGSRGLFDRVIMQSGPCTLRWPWAASPAGPQAETWRPKPRAQAARQAIDVATQTGCPDLRTAAACLRAKPVSALLKVAAKFGFGPAYGGGVIPSDPVKELKAGRFAKVPVMHGITRDEHVTFQVGFDGGVGGEIPAKDYPAVLGQFLGLGKARVAKVVEQYPLSSYKGSTSWALSSVMTDWAWACPASQTNDLLSGHVPTYSFEFADRGAPWFKQAPAQKFPTGAFHAGELQYLFSRAYAGGELSAEQRQLSDQMIDYWTSFARTGDPNSQGGPGWPAYRTGAHQVLALAPGQDGISEVDLYASHRCGFWKSVS